MSDSFMCRSKEFLRSLPRDWPATVKLTAYALFTYADPRTGGGIACSVETLARLIGETERTVQRAQAYLRGGGFLLDDGSYRPDKRIKIPIRRFDFDRIAAVSGTPVSDHVWDVHPDTCTGVPSDVSCAPEPPMGVDLCAVAGVRSDTQTEVVLTEVVRTPVPTPESVPSRTESDTEIRQLALSPELPVTTKQKCEDVIAKAWNAMAQSVGRKQIRDMTAQRRRSIVELVGRYGVDGVLAGIEKVGQSSFLRGETERWPQGATFDFLLRPGRLLRVIEGNYDDPAAPKPKYRNGAHELQDMIDSGINPWAAEDAAEEAAARTIEGSAVEADNCDVDTVDSMPRERRQGGGPRQIGALIGRMFDGD